MTTVKPLDSTDCDALIGLTFHTYPVARMALAAIREGEHFISVKMTEEDAADAYTAWRRGLGMEMHSYTEFAGWLAALRSIGAIKP